MTKVVSMARTSEYWISRARSTASPGDMTSHGTAGKNAGAIRNGRSA